MIQKKNSSSICFFETTNPLFNIEFQWWICHTSIQCRVFWIWHYVKMSFMIQYLDILQYQKDSTMHREHNKDHKPLISVLHIHIQKSFTNQEEYVPKKTLRMATALQRLFKKLGIRGTTASDNNHQSLSYLHLQ